MSSAATRAEARRKAILSRGSDRLSKLTSSARGEDHPVYINSLSEPPPRNAAATETFIGDESIMPTLPARSSPAPAPQVSSADGPSAWTPEQQQDFLRALMAAPELTGVPPTAGQHSALLGPGSSPGHPAEDDPMAAMMSALTQLTGQVPPGGAPPVGMGMGQAIESPRPKTLLAKLLPLVHLVATWSLLAFFALYKEPEEYNARAHAAGNNTFWQRWAELGWRNAGGFGVQAISFFWAFTTLQLVLHSIQIFSKSNPIQPPALLALALPHLPPTVSSIILNAMTYLRMGGMLLDDVAGLVVGVGMLIWIAGWMTGR